MAANARLVFTSLFTIARNGEHGYHVCLVDFVSFCGQRWSVLVQLWLGISTAGNWVFGDFRLPFVEIEMPGFQG